MKTIKVVTTREVNKLQIKHDEYVDSPREWNNIGIFLSKSLPDDRNVNYLDRPSHAVSCETAWEIIEDDSVQFENGTAHAKDIADRLGDVHVIPVYKYEHGDVSIFIEENGTMCKFDTGVTGFYIVHKSDIADMGLVISQVKGMIASEMKEYTKWCNGEVYRYALLDDEGEIQDSCGGFYSLDDIQADIILHDKSWAKEDMSKYLID